MSADVLAYLPLLSPIVTPVVFVLGVFAQNRHVDNRITDLRAVMEAQFKLSAAEMRLALNELEARLSARIDRLETRLERLEGQRLVR